MSISKQTRALHQSACKALYTKDNTRPEVLDRDGNPKWLAENQNDYFETLRQQQGQTSSNLMQTVKNAADWVQMPNNQKEALLDQLYAYVKKHFGDAAVPNKAVVAQGKWDVTDFPHDADQEHAAIMRATTALSGGRMSVKKKTLDKASYEPSADDDKYLMEGFFGNLFKPIESHVYFHAATKQFVGHIDGRPFPATSERGLFKHLTNKAGFPPHQAASFIDKVKSGNPSGMGQTKSIHHLAHALAHVNAAQSAHRDGNELAKEYHLQQTNGHLDKALKLATQEFRDNPKAYADLSGNKNHPIHQHLDAISNVIKQIE